MSTENKIPQIREVLDMLGLVYPEDATDSQLVQFILNALMQYHSQIFELKNAIKNMTESFEKYSRKIKREYSNISSIIEYEHVISY